MPVYLFSFSIIEYLSWNGEYAEPFPLAGGDDDRAVAQDDVVPVDHAVLVAEPQRGSPPGPPVGVHAEPRVGPVQRRGTVVGVERQRRPGRQRRPSLVE